jgi:hypothetical protein
MTGERDDLAGDLLHGGEAIAGYTGLKCSQVFYLWKIGALPLFKVGNTLCGLKSELRDALRSRPRERQSQAAAE